MASSIWAGLDIGVESTSICVLDQSGEVLQQGTCPSSLKHVHDELKWLKRRKRATISLEAGVGTSLARGLRALGYRVEVYEARQLSKFLKVRRNKTDAGDARGIAEAGRIGADLVSRVHVKTLDCQMLQSRLAMRRHFIRTRVRAVSLLCRQVELYGGRIRCLEGDNRLGSRANLEIARLFPKGSPSLAGEFCLLLQQREHLLAIERKLDRELRCLARDNRICRKFMTVPGVGPICALSFYASVGEPDRFKRVSDIGSYFGLTPRIHQSGLVERFGRISKMGNRHVRSLLVRSAMSFLRWGDPDCALHHWARSIEQRRGRGRAKVALARKLAMIMLSMWKSGESFDRRPPAGAPGVTGGVSGADLVPLRADQARLLS